jgi:signal transduction histidine kinase
MTRLAADQQVQILQRNTLRLLRLVKTLLDFSRLEAGRLGANFARVDVGALTQDVASAFRASTEAAGMQFTVSCADVSAVEAYVDAEMWENNAMRYGGGSPVVVSAQAVGGMAQLSVRDQGKAMAPEACRRNFAGVGRAAAAVRQQWPQPSGCRKSLVANLCYE